MLTLGAARDLARRMVEELRPGCQRIEVAGSIRREKPQVKDVEIVLVPEPEAGASLWTVGGPTPVEAVVQGWLDTGRMIPGGRNGPRWKTLAVALRPDVKLDLFITPPESWGLQFCLRTGPAKFSRALVSTRAKGGLLPDGHRVQERRVWQGDIPLSLPEEIDFLAFCGVGWIEPSDRRWPLNGG